MSRRLQGLPAELRVHRGLIFLLLAYIAISLWMIFRLPAFSGPNEALHYEQFALMRRDLSFPDPNESKRMDERHQPPVFYLAAAMAGWRHPNPLTDREFPGNPHYLATHQGNLNPKVHADLGTAPLLYTGRLVSLSFGLLGVLCVYLMVLTFLRGESGHWPALLAAGFTAFHPGWLHLSATAANDLPVSAMSALALLVCNRVLCSDSPEARRSLIWGAVFGLALLTKANAVFLAIAMAFVGLIGMRRFGLLEGIKHAACGVAALLLVYLPWLGFNSYRGLDLTGVERSVPVARLLTLRPADLPEMAEHLSVLFQSFWMDWSRGEVGYGPDLIYFIGGLFTLLGLLGWIARSRSDSMIRDIPAFKQAAAMHALWAAGLVVFFIAVKTLMVKETGFLSPEGRWILPMLPSLAWLVALGFNRLWLEQKRNRACAALLALLAFQAAWLAFVWLPEHYPTARWEEGRTSVSATSTGWRYGDALALEDIVVPDEMILGRPSSLKLGWNTLEDLDQDYTVSTQLLWQVPDSGRIKLDEQNSYPGLGTAPTKGRPAASTLEDLTQLIPQGDLPGPVLGKIGVWVLPSDSEGRPLESFLDGALAEPLVAHTRIYPDEPLSVPEESLLEGTVRFGERIELLGYALSGLDDESTLTLYWRALGQPEADYRVFVHLVNAEGEMIGNADGPPAGGASPSSIWREGDVLQDVRNLTAVLGEMRNEGEAPAELRVGLYDPGTGIRLRAEQFEEGLPDDAYSLPSRGGG